MCISAKGFIMLRHALSIALPAAAVLLLAAGRAMDKAWRNMMNPFAEMHIEYLYWQVY